jgi:hypothetical protein
MKFDDITFHGMLSVVVLLVLFLAVGL